MLPWIPSEISCWSVMNVIPVRAVSCLGWVRKLPLAVDDRAARPVETDRAVPAVHDRQQVRCARVAAAELNRNRAVLRLLGGDVVDGVGVQLVLLEEAARIVDGHG